MEWQLLLVSVQQKNKYILYKFSPNKYRIHKNLIKNAFPTSFVTFLSMKAGVLLIKVKKIVIIIKGNKSYMNLNIYNFYSPFSVK